MNKVKCTNGHFFDLDRFAACPFCGGTVATGNDIAKSGKPAISVRPSVQEYDDKTTLLDDKTTLLDDEVTVMLPINQVETKEETGPVAGVAGGIKWRFGAASKQEQLKENETLPVEEEANVEETLPEYDEFEDATMPMPMYTPKAQSEESTKNLSMDLSQAVAATGGAAYSALPKTMPVYDYDQTEEVKLPPMQGEPVVGWLVCLRGIYRGQSFPCRAGRNRIGRNADCGICLTEDISVSRESQAIIIYEPKSRKFYLQSGEGSGLAYLNGELLFSYAELNARDLIQLGNGEYTFIPLCGETFTWDDYLK